MKRDRALPAHYSRKSMNSRNTQTRDRDMILSKLNPDDFHEIVDAVEEFRIMKADLPAGMYGASSKTVARAVFRRGDRLRTPDGPGIVDGIATEDGSTPSPFVRINGRLYHWTKLTHV